MKRRIAALVLSLAICVSLFAGITVSAAGYTPKYTEEADALYTLGLFQGMGKNTDGTPKYALEQKATRIQGLVMLIRLLGKETEALAYTGECPFTDVPEWAAPYAAYAYGNGITKGTSATTFSADAPLLGKAYVTFVLRALGYDDAAGDFSYDKALEKGQELRLIEAGACTGDIYRDDCVIISYNALKTKMKDSDTMLAIKLTEDGVLSSSAVQNSKLFRGKVKLPFTVTENPNGRTKYLFNFDCADILAAFPNAAYFNGGGWGGHSKTDFDRMDFSLYGIWRGSYTVRAKLEGKEIGDPITPDYSYGVSTNCKDGYNVLVVLDKDLNLIGYGFIYPWYPAVSGEIELTTVFYNGTEDQNRINSIVSKVKKYNGDALYCEKVITKHADGTETVNEYLRVDEEKWPEELKGFKYYAIGNGDSKDDFIHDYISGRIILNMETDTLPGSHSFGDSIRFYIYDENKDIIACIKPPRDLPVVETVIEE